jgi:hypothetical protein
MAKSIEINTLYAATRHLQDQIGYIVLFHTGNKVECLILFTNDTKHDFINKDEFFTMLDTNQIEKVETLSKDIIKELKKKHCR